MVRPDGTGLRRLTQPGICCGAPKWSPDGTRVIFYEIPVEQTWAAHWPGQDASTTSQIVSVDVASGERQRTHDGPGLKVMPQFLTNDVIGYLAKAGAEARASPTPAGPAWWQATCARRPGHPTARTSSTRRSASVQGPRTCSCTAGTPNYEYRYTDVFPSFSKDGKLLLTRKDGDSSLDIMDPDGSNRQEVFPSNGGTAFSPSWSPDGQSIVFGYGGFLQSRNRQAGKDHDGAPRRHERHNAHGRHAECRLPELVAGRHAGRLPGVGR